MLVKHRCGHEVNVPPRNAPFVRRMLCWECERLVKRLQEEQHRKIAEARECVMKAA